MKFCIVDLVTMDDVILHHVVAAFATRDVISRHDFLYG